MTRLIEMIRIPGEVVDRINQYLDGTNPPPDGEIAAEPFTATFRDNYTAHVRPYVEDGEVHIAASLLDQGDNLVESLDPEGDAINREYVFDVDSDTWIFVIQRAANETLTDEAKARYLETGGVRCPYCSDDDIHGGFVEVDERVATQTVSCNHCNASWRDTYQLSDVEHLESPDNE